MGSWVIQQQVLWQGAKQRANQNMLALPALAQVIRVGGWGGGGGGYLTAPDDAEPLIS